MKHKYLLSLALSIFIGVGVSLFVPPSNVSALNPINYTSHLIDDTVFTDSNSMGFASNQSNAQNIQAFLNSQGSGLAGFSAIETCASGIHYSYYASYYACGKNASAAQIIAAASQAYAINPRVILATLQKEQSLITNPNPAQSELDCAMGYLSCGGALGFFNQVDNAAWQFRTDMNLGSGISWWGYSPASYPCNNADTITHLYDNGLKAGNAVTFYNNANPNGYDTPYASFTLPNMSTASLYCYTPHVYNNPNGINGKPQYGSVGSYWSGTYNFVNAFINWWGTTYTSGFQASNVSQSAPATVIRGNSTFAFVKYQNAGSQPWYDDVSAPQYNTYGVHLATTNPINVGNQFSAFWPARNRAAMTFAHVYEADGVTLAANQHIAQPGQIVEFDFNFSVSSNTAPGTYENYFQPILDGSTLWNMGGVSRFNITVQQPTFQATFAGQSAFPTITQGASSAAYLKYQNSGNEPWYDNTTASIYNTYAVHLATTSPINSASPFSSSWPANNRPAINFAHVYEGDGVTLAANQHIAQPGQIVEFDFSFNANVAGGAYRQYFQPILEGSTLWNMGALSWLDVTVQ